MEKQTKRKRTTNEEAVFAGRIFVICSTFSKQSTFKKLIESHGGTIRKKLSSKVDFFLQSYHEEDDDRLAEAKECKVTVINPRYVKDCITSGKILDFYEHSVGMHVESASNPFSLPLGRFSELFSPILESAREEEEQPQTYFDFCEMTEPPRPTAGTDTIYLLPIGDFDKKPGYLVIEQFMSVYFCMPTAVLPPAIFTKVKQQWHLTMKHSAFQYLTLQFQVMDMIDALIQELPTQKRAYCIVAVTHEDIFEVDDDDVVIMGRATGDRVGVVSTYRFHLQPNAPSAVVSEKVRATCTTRILTTLAHESMHMFGLDHCVFYSCVMNACVDFIDAESADNDPPIRLCPIDLRKLHTAVGFDVLERYRRLHQLFVTLGLKQEAQWLDLRIQSLSHLSKSTK